MAGGPDDVRLSAIGQLLGAAAVASSVSRLSSDRVIPRAEYFRVPDDPAGIAVTPEKNAPQESEAGSSIHSEFVITPETLARYRLPSRGTSLGLLR
jgi:hypothetical protein